MARFLSTFAWLSGRQHVRGLDVGAGYGLLVRMLRDRGLDFRWTDQYAENLLARGFEDDGGTYNWLTMVEVFEHLVEPYEFISRSVEKYHPECVFFTTVTKPATLPPPTWWYWTFETGQHISFACNSSLAALAERLRFGLVSHGSYHLLTRRPGDRETFLLAASKIGRMLSSLALRRLTPLTLTDHTRLVDLLRRSDKSDSEVGK